MVSLSNHEGAESSFDGLRMSEVKQPASNPLMVSLSNHGGGIAV